MSTLPRPALFDVSTVTVSPSALAALARVGLRPEDLVDRARRLDFDDKDPHALAQEVAAALGGRDVYGVVRAGGVPLHVTATPGGPVYVETEAEYVAAVEAEAGAERVARVVVPFRRN